MNFFKKKCVHTVSGTDNYVNLFLLYGFSKLKKAWGTGEYFTSKSNFLEKKKGFVTPFLIVISAGLWCLSFCCCWNTFKKEKEKSRLLGFSYHWESSFILKICLITYIISAVIILLQNVWWDLAVLKWAWFDLACFGAGGRKTK